MRKLGIVCFSSYSGLGNQSRRLTQFLKPERILLIDNSGFSRNTDQHPDWYDGFNGYHVKGFPTRMACIKFLQGLTHLYVIENPLNWDLIQIAKGQKVKSYIATNFEFCDNLIHPEYPLPDMFLMPSYWKVAEMKDLFGEDRVRYLPPPIFPNDLSGARDHNMCRKGKRRFVHIVGTLAAADRNGTLLLVEAMKYAKGDFDLVIKSQHDLPPEYVIDDRRVAYKIGSESEVLNMYYDFDAMIMPRRFGGLCLPMQEALMCGLPVIMPDISPNKEILSRSWLVPAEHTGKIRTRTEIDIYSTNPKELAKKIDEFATMKDGDLDINKVSAFDIAHKEYAPSSLEGEYQKLW